MSDYKNTHSFEHLDIGAIKIALVTSKFNADITESMRAAALKAFIEKGGQESQIDCYWVPGAFELPLMAKKIGLTGRYDAILCLGAVIQGETAHFEYISSATIQGLNQVSLEIQLPVLCGVLTTHTLEQAKSRACDQLNIGREYLFSALETVAALQAIQ